MRVIDVQVHAYEHNHPGRPWVGELHGPASANGAEMVAAMDAVGVDGAIIVSTFNLGSSWVSGWWLRDQATRAPTSAARSCLPRLRAL